MNRKDIENVIDKVPSLNANGVGKDYGGSRADLLSSEKTCTACCKWLERIEKIKSINGRHSSYGLKHIAEKEIGYITNGAFIAAAIHCGFAYQLTDGLNVLFAMSERSIKEAIRQHEASA